MAKQTETTEPPRVSVLERRLQNPFGEPAKEVKLKGSNIMPRWFNDDAQTGQVYRARQLGWQPVSMDMIADKDSLGFHQLNAANQITRGPRGQEVLMWMPKTDYEQIQMAKTRVNLDKMRDTNAQAREMIDAAGVRLGEEAAEFLDKHMDRRITVKTTREIVHRSAEADDQP